MTVSWKKQDAGLADGGDDDQSSAGMYLQYDEDRWRWDVSGHLIVRGSMGPEWLQQAHAAIEHISTPAIIPR